MLKLLHSVGWRRWSRLRFLSKLGHLLLALRFPFILGPCEGNSNPSLSCQTSLLNSHGSLRGLFAQRLESVSRMKVVVHSCSNLVLVQEHPVLLTEAPLNPKATWLLVVAWGGGRLVASYSSNCHAGHGRHHEDRERTALPMFFFFSGCLGCAASQSSAYANCHHGAVSSFRIPEASVGKLALRECGGFAADHITVCGFLAMI